MCVTPVLNLKRALRNPLGTAGHAVGSAVRSTSFLSAFVGLYSCFITLHRKLFSWDHKLVYYVAGTPASCQHYANNCLAHHLCSFVGEIAMRDAIRCWLGSGPRQANCLCSDRGSARR